MDDKNIQESFYTKIIKTNMLNNRDVHKAHNVTLINTCTLR